MAKTSEHDTASIYELATKWKNECLVNGKSLLWPEEDIWIEKNVKGFKKCFIDNPDESDKSFEEKFQIQLGTATPEVTKLACDLMLVYFLFPSNVHRSWKIELIQKIASWKNLVLEENNPAFLSLNEGIGSGGIAYNTRRPFEVAFLTLVTLELLSKSRDARRNILNDHLQVREILYKVQGDTNKQSLHIVLHLLFPDTYERISSGAHKQRIAKAFAPLLDKSQAKDDINDRLAAIREKLEKQFPEQQLDFYRSPIKQYWLPSEDDEDVVPIPGLETPEGKKKSAIDFKKLKVVIDRYIKPYWDDNDDLEMRPNGGESYIQDKILPRAAPYLSEESIKTNARESLVGALKADINLMSQFEKMHALTFAENTNVEDLRDQLLDLFYGNEELALRIQAFLEWAEVDKIPDSEAKAGINATAVSFLLAMLQPREMAFCKPTVYDTSVTELIDRAERQLEYVDRIIHCNQVYGQILTFLEKEFGLLNGNLLDVHSILYILMARDGSGMNAWEKILASEAGTVYSPAPEPVYGLLTQRKNVILYGPPGTGKTRAALELAGWWRSAHGSEAVVKTTFHPSYSYEDFIEGYRPDPSKGEFVLTPGIFKTLCERAGKDSDKKFLILIDEINRGDVARILGELITYIEADKRGPGNQVTLQQSGEEFFVPDNIFVLGTMNTADKSISLMDIAIRRRFIFHYYPPDPDVLDNRKEFWDEVGGIRLSRLLIGLNQKLLDAGVDRDRLVGHSYFLINKEDPSPLGVLKTRFRYEVIPLVEEYCYSDRSLMGSILPDIVDSVGTLNQEILDDDERFIRFLRTVSVQE